MIEHHPFFAEERQMAGALPVELDRGAGAPTASEWLLHRAVSGWFLLLGISSCFTISASLQKLELAAAGLYWAQLADLASRTCTMLFFATAAWLTLVRSEPLAKARGLAPRITALLAVTLLFALPLLPRLDPAPTWLLFLSAGLAALGNGLALMALRWLGKCFSVMSEARALVTSGPYRMVRHPLYLSEEIAIIGIFLPYWSWAAAALFIAHLLAQLQRLRNEERVLSETFPDYADYARRTARLIPGIW